MQLPVRYQVMDSRGPDDNVEANIVHTSAQLELDVDEMAIVLVDTWAGHPMSSHLARTGEISRTRIRPVLDAARAAGATVIYAPSPRVAPDFAAFRHDNRETAPPTPPVDDWPPAEYRAETGRYRSLRKRAGEVPEGYDGPYPDWWHMRGIDPAIAPVAGDVVVATGAELHAACKARGLLHLIYAGFATNICIRFPRLRPARNARSRLFTDPAARRHQRDRDASDDRQPEPHARRDSGYRALVLHRPHGRPDRGV